MYESTSKMDKKLKAKWVKALRSGKYKKTTGVLEELSMKGTYIGNCCLGVLCRIEKIEGKTEFNCWDTKKVVSFNNNSSKLTNSLLTKFGISYHDQEELIKRNDGRHDIKGHSFKRIADFIEKNIGVA